MFFVVAVFLFNLPLPNGPIEFGLAEVGWRSGASAEAVHTWRPLSWFLLRRIPLSSTRMTLHMLAARCKHGTRRPTAQDMRGERRVWRGLFLRLTAKLSICTLPISCADPRGVPKMEGTLNIERPTLNVERDWLTANS